MTHTDQAHVTDGMTIECDVPIDMDDGLQLRADIFRRSGRDTTGAGVPWPLCERRQLSNRLCRNVEPAG